MTGVTKATSRKESAQKKTEQTETQQTKAGGKNYDLLTLGEVMIRLSTRGPARLEQAHALNVHAGGGEMNVACACSRLGLRAAFVTRLPENPLGRLAAGQARLHGVDTAPIVWSPDPSDRMGLYFLEQGGSPRPDSVLYDRRHSAVSRLEPAMVDWPALFARVRWFHVTGITPALSEAAARTTLHAVKTAKQQNVEVSFDLNYRFKLWTLEQARPVMAEICALADHLITTEQDADRLFALGSTDYGDVARRLHARFGCKTAAVTLRENLSTRHHRWSAVCFDGDRVHDDITYDLQIIDRVGGGDAFAAGYIFGMLDTGRAKQALRCANAVSALKHSIPGDVCWCTRSEVEALLAGRGGVRIQR
jgi:2-dehydro-3-deoxygluconokinase